MKTLRNPLTALRHLATAACAALAFTLTACDVDDGLVTLPDGTEVLVTVDGKPSSNRVTVHPRQESRHDTPEKRYVRAVDAAKRGMARAVPGSPEYRKWETILDNADDDLREEKRIEKIGLAAYVSELTEPLPSAQRQALLAPWQGTMAMASASATKQTTTTNTQPTNICGANGTLEGYWIQVTNRSCDSSGCTFDVEAAQKTYVQQAGFKLPYPLSHKIDARAVSNGLAQKDDIFHYGFYGSPCAEREDASGGFDVAGSAGEDICVTVTATHEAYNKQFLPGRFLVDRMPSSDTAPCVRVPNPNNPGGPGNSTYYLVYESHEPYTGVGRGPGIWSVTYRKYSRKGGGFLGKMTVVCGMNGVTCPGGFVPPPTVTSTGTGGSGN